MKKYLMRDICFMRKGQTISEKDLYYYRCNHEDVISVISSSTDNNGIMGYIDNKHSNKFKFIGEADDLTWVTNGYAGKVTLRLDKFLPTEKCGVISVKPKYKDLINNQWLEIYLNSITLNYVIAKEGNSKLEVAQMKNIPILLPDIKEQEDIVTEYNKIKKVEDIIDFSELKITDIINNIFNIKNSEVERIKLGSLFDLFQGHQLTDKFIYDNHGDVPVFSGSDNSIKGYINKKLFSGEDLPCIIYQTKGNHRYKSKVIYSDFNVNNTAVLIPKKKWKEKYYIEYIQLTLHKNMNEVVNSKGGVSYVDTKILNTYVEIPPKDIQKEILEEYNKICELKVNLYKIKEPK